MSTASHYTSRDYQINGPDSDGDLRVARHHGGSTLWFTRADLLLMLSLFPPPPAPPTVTNEAANAPPSSTAPLSQPQEAATGPLPAHSQGHTVPSGCGPSAGRGGGDFDDSAAVDSVSQAVTEGRSLSHSAAERTDGQGNRKPVVSHQRQPTEYQCCGCGTILMPQDVLTCPKCYPKKHDPTPLDLSTNCHLDPLFDAILKHCQP